MPTIADLLSSKINPTDPNDQLRDQMGQGQTLQGLAQQPGQGAAAPPVSQPVAPSPNVPGPLAAFAVKPRIRAKIGAQGFKPAAVVKPRIRLKLKALANV